MKFCLAECLGTFVLVLIGCGSAVLTADHIGHAGVSTAFGFTLIAMVYTVGPISGCQLNPAVTFGMTLSGKFPKQRAFGYIAAPIVGAVLASAILYVIASGPGTLTHLWPVSRVMAMANASPGTTAWPRHSLAKP